MPKTPKQLLFKILIRPLFPIGQWVVMKTRINRGPPITEGLHRRQRFLLGHLKAGVSPREAALHLKQFGFRRHRVAFTDGGQELSLRRLCEKHHDRQYHARIYDDGEVRCHYEYTPDDHPIRHLREDIFLRREDRFMPWVKDICDLEALSDDIVENGRGTIV